MRIIKKETELIRWSLIDLRRVQFWHLRTICMSHRLKAYVQKQAGQQVDETTSCQ